MIRRLFLAMIGLAGFGVIANANPVRAQSEPQPNPGAPAVTTPTQDSENTLIFTLSTGGVVTIGMRPDKAPKHVERIKTLTRQGFYDGTPFHRVIDGFMAQGGDPTGTGMSGSKLPNLPAEFNDLPHVRGTVSMARTNDPNSANSQFFICFQPSMWLDGQYTVWGRVIDGMDAVDAIERGEPPRTPTRIVKAQIAADVK
jgi:peptidylprolyl isomerase